MPHSRLRRRRSNGTRAAKILVPRNAVKLEPCLVDLTGAGVDLEDGYAEGWNSGRSPVPGDVVAAANDNEVGVERGWGGVEDGRDVGLLGSECYRTELRSYVSQAVLG